MQELVGVASERLQEHTGGGVGFSCTHTSAGESQGAACRMRATAPVTCGEAIEVPLIVTVAVSSAYPADWMDEPGAKMSLHGRSSSRRRSSRRPPMLPTVMAASTRAGL